MRSMTSTQSVLVGNMSVDACRLPKPEERERFVA